MTNPIPHEITGSENDTLVAIFSDPSLIGSYGATEQGASALESVSELMERGAVAKLSDSIGRIVAALTDADPQKIAARPSYLDKLLGRGIEREIRYRVARDSLDALLEDAEVYADGARQTVHSIDALIAQHGNESARIAVLLQAGREYLEENPEAGVHADPTTEFDRPRERFARRLANLATLVTSHEMSVLQMKLARAQAVDMLDRFTEIATVLVPVWRQHALALITTTKMSPALVAAATQAHQALMRSLAKTLDTEQH